ncbi:MAG TPA: cytochrome c3 family protein [Terriglobales bacterium]|nr:cytochrome c3 family protein [Terriglobales bacterium]
MKTWKAILLAIAIVATVASIWATLVIQRGFRATAEPSAWEAALARRVRDLAIPTAARRQKNPLQANPQNLEEGRSNFLARCEVCHGQDGSGLTPVGGNLYPRVPDLRAAPTQALSDGEIHYIIENGVQLTGMPAWGNPHQQGSDESWKLVLFIRSLRPLSRQERTQQATTAAQARYVGSQACEKCHQEIFQHWKKTPMANIVRDPATHPEAVLGDFSHAPFSRKQIALVYGNLWKQNYFTKVGDLYYPLPGKWAIAQRKWIPYLVKDDWWATYFPPDDMRRPTATLCDGCHSVNYDVETHTVTEWNVGCERCHGPGSEHVAHPTRGNILNPARMDYVAANDTCIQCHSQGRPLDVPSAGKVYDWPVGYNVGLKLQNFWRLEPHPLGSSGFYYFPDGTAHKNRMQGNDFVQSVMYRRGITCFNCHDVHGTGNYAQLRKPAEQICLDCHGPLSPNGPRTATLEQHTHHKAGTAGSYCVDCHMPQIETESAPGAFVHAHTFRFISPEMTDKYNIPNPCNACHKDKSTAWALDALRLWPERSPWRLE